MLNRNKKTIVFALILLISFSSISYFIPKTESIDPFFTLVARAFTPQQMDIFFLMKQQIAMMGVNIDPIFTIAPNGDSTKIRDFDLTIIEFQNNMSSDPFFADFYSENGTMNVSGYDTELDWDEGLGNGKNQWYIETGLQLTPNNSQERIDFCWEWQNYLLDDILSCLPLFTNGNLTLYLVFNMREVRPIIGSREPIYGYPSKPIGLGVRKALTYAINREEIKTVVMGDSFKINHNPINPNLSSWLNPNVVKYCHDLTAARDFMTTVGFDTCWRPEQYIGYGSWPNWEDVCSKNMITINYAGFNLISSAIILIMLSQVFLVKQLIALKRKKKQLKRRSLGD